jgi:hypothetical protein
MLNRRDVSLGLRMVACGALTGLVLAMPANASSAWVIHLDVGIGPVNLGGLRQKVVPILGASRPIRLGGTTFVFYPRVALAILYGSGPSQPARILGIETKSARFRTAVGIGVGSSKAGLKAHGVRCYSLTQCQHDSPKTKTVTLFYLDRYGIVKEIFIGIG